MSETPRTDAKATRRLLNIGETATKYEVVPSDFARQLERELAEMTKRWKHYYNLSESYRKQARDAAKKP